MISEKIITQQDTVIVRLTEVVTLKDSVIVYKDSTIKDLKKKNRHKIIKALIVGACVGAVTVLAIR